MSAIKTLRAADYPRMPWKNGGGSTLEIVKDAGKGLEGFGWRLSIADIAESGGFFGVQRLSAHHYRARGGGDAVGG